MVVVVLLMTRAMPRRRRRHRPQEQIPGYHRHLCRHHLIVTLLIT